MTRRISQISIALVAVVTLSACIIITSDSEDFAAAPPEPATAQAETKAE